MSESVYENVVKEVDNLLNKKIEKKYQRVISDIDKIISTYEFNNYKNQEIHQKNRPIRKQNSIDNKETIISIPSMPDRTIITMYEIIDKVKK